MSSQGEKNRMNLFLDAHELVLLLDGLELAVSVLGRGVDEAHVDGLRESALCSRDDGLAEGDDSLAAAHHAAAYQ